MNGITTYSVAAALAAALLSTPAFAQTAAPADAIYVGGDIVTMSDKAPAAQALAVKDGKIVAVGDRKTVESAHKGAKTRVVDLKGKALLPGFIDAHSHYFSSLTVANQCNVYAPPAGPGKDVATIVATIKKFAAEKKIAKGEVIQCYGYDENVMPKGRHVNRDDLDRAFPDNPVLVGHVSMHGAVLNSAAMKKWNVSAATKTPPGGVIVRKPGTDEPYGLIMETAYLPIFASLPKPTPAQEVEWSLAGQQLYAASGVTTAHEGATHAAELAVMQRAAKSGGYIIDVIAYPFVTELQAVLKDNPAAGWQKYDQRLKIGGVKVTIDGSPQGRTAAFTKPYLTGGPGGEKDWNGELAASQEIINKAVKAVYDLGVPLNLHANGDAAIDAFFKAHESAAAGDLGKERNVTMIHAQFTRKDQIDKFVQYKVRPSFYTLHTYYFAEAHIANRGKEQAMYISPMRDAIDKGLKPTNHTDFVVAPLDQMFMLWTAVNRVSRAGASIGPDQRVTPMEGLKAMTIWSAEQHREGDIKGSLEAGKLADLVILDKNPLKVDRKAIKDIKVVETIKEGRTIYRKGT
jgi:predicted amidohydrolase YtcJ